MIKTIILMPVMAYLGAFIAVHQFGLDHSWLIVPSKDGQYIKVHDVDNERMKRDVERKKKNG